MTYSGTLGRCHYEHGRRVAGKASARTVRYDAPKVRITHRDNPTALLQIVLQTFKKTSLISFKSQIVNQHFNIYLNSKHRLTIFE